MGWIRLFIFSHGVRHPAEMGLPEVNRFLSHLAVEGKVSASTQNQAFVALLFLYKQVLQIDLGFVERVVRAFRPKRLPVVLIHEEVRAVVKHLDGVPRLVCSLLYGGGLRLLGCLSIRVKDPDSARAEIVVRHGQGGKDRVTSLPDSVKDPLLGHLEVVKKLHEKDLSIGLGQAPLPDAISKKYPSADRSWAWQYVFPASGHDVDRQTGVKQRHHVHELVIQRAMKWGRARVTDIKTGDAPPSSPLVRHPDAGNRLRYRNDSRTPRPQRCRNNHDLHPRLELRPQAV